MAFFKVVAVDLDGTLTSSGNLDPDTVRAIDQSRSDGLAIVVATGRIGAELRAEFPQLAGHVDALVLENGAVVSFDGQAHALAPPVAPDLDEALAKRGIPYRRGRVLVAVDGEHRADVAEVIGELGMDYQLIRNRAALMVLPAGITKGTGLSAILEKMNLSPHNTVAVGDAENDLSLLAVAEVGVAVANAVPSLRRFADVVLDEPGGAGVTGLLTGPYLSGAERLCPSRHWLEIGVFDDGTPTRLPGSQARILVTGPAASGKSYLVGLMAEQWISAGYCVLVIDPEGDHLQLQQLSHVQVVDVGHHLPEPAELVDALRPNSGMVVDLSGLAEPGKTDYVRRLRSTAEAHREQYGFPHWVIYDEAHLLGIGAEAHWARRGGYVLCSFAPASLPAHEIDSSDVVLALTRSDTAAGLAFRRCATIRFGSGPPREFTFGERETRHVRHRHKYADIRLPAERRFYFHTTDGLPIAPAATMHDFTVALRRLDQQALEYHLERGDFSRWLEGTIADNELAARVAAWEDDLDARRAADLERIRHQLVQAVEKRYLPSEERH
ncbi:HAD family hydrolase [Mycobacterium nebraskense]|uniref:HAD family hydrolase n=1 Tax=Mycobacterium nebraskense TaxID=244292 RepID=A0A0F5N923_9MYCO|nr:HAD-IIB family hydrolase [Mycobacterium nebraskense]KKC03579.1 HAD family hydrolase [Mycobacterium nebraskense]KLO38269.1 HAD family hydrolase [Mycobacterium nebraskense]MBI2695238.1 HAD family phosphatase [Mycobacterium nebraskense]MCV7118832.1 HAD family phosphatase [Mycobacterium nebraskense]ORW20830.1 HAD family hydrolase [Mycobacterium nebraskense]